MKKYVILTALVLALFSQADAEEIIRKGELLTLERSIQIALMKHPDILAAKGTVDVNLAKKGQAESGYYPQIDASAVPSDIFCSFRVEMFPSFHVDISPYCQRVLNPSLLDFSNPSSSLRLRPILISLLQHN